MISHEVIPLENIISNDSSVELPTGENSDGPKKPASNAITSTLLFAVISVAYGSSFTLGYNLGSTNIPQMIMVQWIREVRCKQLRAEYADRDDDDNYSNNETLESWCKNVSMKELEELFTDFLGLNWMWTGVSVVYIAGAMVGAVLSRRLVQQFGRKGALLVNNAPGIVGGLLMAISYTANSFEILLIGRGFVGFHTGVTAVVATVYFMELVPITLRGTFGCIQAAGEAFGTLFAEILSLPSILGGAKTWPYLLGMSAVPCIFQLATLPFCPESPHYLFVVQDDEQGARYALKRLRRLSNFGMEIADMQEERNRLKNEPTISFFGICADPHLRKVLVIGLVTASSLELTGLNVALLYSTYIFQSAGATETTASYGTIGLGGLLLGATLLTTTGFVERIGRKPLLLFGFAGMALALGLLTTFLATYESRYETFDTIESSSSPDYWLPYAAVACLFLFQTMHALGPGTITLFLIAEMFSQNARDAATNGAVAIQWFGALIVVLAFPLIQAQARGLTFLIFIVLLVFYFIYVWIYLPETKGKEPEEIQADIHSHKAKCRWSVCAYLKKMIYGDKPVSTETTIIDSVNGIPMTVINGRETDHQHPHTE
ncbi:solute carrier family 2, facilitated glucose transporter member 4-like [Paramacrobiotus metropolitanus]|uniref:solute carrier family 2, facilitated glucose transporter member 4-like n=1 Tax=Paramacrobiotus metropolitanus TaxID=2943436 RepID=UPI002446328B|nr:solute carrier family 2, facilitated glucose transporter member 4-like [Paramacrobiotus metropolitanus]XP_055338986.1 solute carrier family 2, facilitated glucose transporter member 4-like [Paramacrobiotus metropolitanus]XP_055338987.1 solute carrier family 2, facilitated glucose transporter member 4-like [Paramacrobiotus metropolitanus]XP_055338988.1 solute carrier family 2, facilitated glucose transporter member 4-like [Paramacrobiotus metropolitanus]XP_055338989.1 solute carrier family 2,